jgi:hypothetical protein
MYKPLGENCSIAGWSCSFRVSSSGGLLITRDKICLYNEEITTLSKRPSLALPLGG